MGIAMDTELDALKQCHEALEPLEQDVQVRTIHWLIDKYDLTTYFIGSRSPGKSAQPHASHGFVIPALGLRSEAEQLSEAAQVGLHPWLAHETLAEAFGMAKPKTNTDKALLVAVWMKLREGKEEFTGQDVNTALKDLGHAVDNITRTMGNLMEVKPQLVVQLKKAGTSKQARKTIKVTVAGVDKVKTMFNGSES